MLGTSMFFVLLVMIVSRVHSFAVNSLRPKGLNVRTYVERDIIGCDAEKCIIHDTRTSKGPHRGLVIAHATLPNLAKSVGLTATKQVVEGDHLAPCGRDSREFANLLDLLNSVSGSGAPITRRAV